MTNQFYRGDYLRKNNFSNNHVIKMLLGFSWYTDYDIPKWFALDDLWLSECAFMILPVLLNTCINI